MIFPCRKLLKDMPEFYVPEVIEDLTSKQVLTTELIDGTSLDRIENPDQDTINKVLMALELKKFSYLPQNSLELIVYM